jgi:hypothetical protein
MATRTILAGFAILTLLLGFSSAVIDYSVFAQTSDEEIRDELNNKPEMS